MELTYLRVPCIVAGNPIYHAIPLHYPRNQSDYFNMIDSADDLEVTQEQEDDVTKYLYLLKNKHILVKCIAYHSKLKQTLLECQRPEGVSKKGR